MPTWGELLKELNDERQKQKPAGLSEFDVIRRRYISKLHKVTGRNVIVYATRWTQGGPAELISINAEDVQGFMEVVHGLPSNKGLDLILHSPGGSAEVTESLVTYLRSKFSDLRIIVPHAAMSAATMFACAADRILMGRHSFLGPIDPQFIVQSDGGRKAVPAHAIVEQFRMAQEECKKDPQLLPSWLPILRQYGPSLLVECRFHTELAELLVSQWLATYMFAKHPEGAAKATEKAKQIAKALNDHAHFKTHSRFVSRDKAKELGLIIEDLEVDQKLQDAVLSVFHAFSHTFGATPTVKIIENFERAFIKSQLVIQTVVPQQP